MSIYAVYARAPHSTLWSLRELFATKAEADAEASAAVNAPGDTAGSEAAASVVVEWDDESSVPERLPEQWVAPVVARFGDPDLMPSEAPQATGA